MQSTLEEYCAALNNAYDELELAEKLRQSVKNALTNNMMIGYLIEIHKAQTFAERWFDEADRLSWKLEKEG